jgi:KDO2-lipid IV(A) lauroyltransferase
MGVGESGASGDEFDATPRARILQAVLDGSTWLFDRLPLERAGALARGFGRVWVALKGPRTRRVRSQLARAFPDASAADLAVWTRQVFEHLAQGLAELLVLRGQRGDRLLDRVEVEGLEHLRAAESMTTRGGVLVVTAHLGNWELACAKMASMGLAISAVYRGLREPVLDRALLELRGRARGAKGVGSEVQQIRMGHAGLPVVRALEAGRKVVVVLDQDADREEGVFVSFFGRPASTRSGAIELAMMRGIPVVPVFIVRSESGRTHHIEIGPAMALEAGAHDDAERVIRNVQRVTDAIERAIRRAPGQWVWTHRRWRTQPRVTSPSEVRDDA